MSITNGNPCKSLITFMFCVLVGVQCAIHNSQAASDEALLKELVEQFFDAYTKENLDGFMALWSEHSPDFAKRREIMQQIFADNDNIQVKSLDIVKVKLDADKAKVRVVVEMSGLEAKTGEPSKIFGKLNRTLYMAREGKAWKIWRYVPTEEDLVNVLLAAEKKEVRVRLLNEEKESVTAELVRTLYNAGDAQAEQGKFAVALSLNTLAFEVAEVVGDKAALAWCYVYRGLMFAYQSQYAVALENWQDALQLFQEAKDKAGEAATLGSIGNVYESMSKYTEALRVYKVSLKIAKEIGDKAGEAMTLNNIGNVYKSMGKSAEALAHYEESLKIKREIGDLAGEAATLNNTGIVYRLMGKYAEALGKYGESLNIVKEMGDEVGEAMTLNNTGEVYRLMGNYAEALGRYETSLKVFRKLGRKAEEVAVLNNIGNIYVLTSKYTEALRAYEARLKIAKEIGDKAGEAMTLNNIGEVYRLMDNYTEALRAFEDSLNIAKEIGDKAGEATTLNNIGIAYVLVGKYMEALEAYEASLKIVIEIGDNAGGGATLNNIGVAYRLMGNYAEALETLETALKISKLIGDIDTAFRSHFGIAEVYSAQKQWSQAVDAYRKSIALIEQVRALAKEPSLQMGFFEQYTDPYYGLITSLVTLNKKDEEAFQTAESTKARTLIELLQGVGVEITKAMTEEENRGDQELNERIVLANLELRKLQSQPNPNQSQLEDVKERLAAARRDYDAFRRQLYLAHPELQAQRGESDPLTVEEAKQWLQAQGAQDLLVLEYVVGDDQMWLFALSGIGELEVYPIKLTHKELMEHVKDLREAIRQKEDPGRQLDSLLAPAEPLLAKARQVCIIPDDVLWEVPFDALKTPNGKYLIETHAVFYAPSLTALKAEVKASKERQRQSSNPMLAMAPFAYPDAGDQNRSRKMPLRDTFGPLPFSENEVTVVANLFGAQPYLREDATEALAKTEVGKAYMLHFTTHGFFDTLQGMYSGVVMAEEKEKDAKEDGYLEAREVVDLDLNADLAVLSACETARGQLSRGEGILGLSWAFFVAGCPSTVVSQWKVSDPSTAAFMKRFYRNLKLGMTKAEALMEAKQWMMKYSYHTNENGEVIRHNHPYYWAPFILIGAHE